MALKSRRHAKSLAEFVEFTGIRQNDLAALLGVSQSTVSLYVAGKRHPRIGLAVKISRLTGVPVEHLVAPDSNSNAEVQVA